jgi:hypothetical protein
MLMFGGWAGFIEGHSDQLWELSMSGQPRWTRLFPDGPTPPGRSEHTAIYDPIRDRMIVCGGYNGSRLSDVWALELSDTPVWVELTPGTPGPQRSGHTAIYDPVGDEMLVFGGDPPNRETWALSFSGEAPEWRMLNPAGSPPSTRREHTAIYDAENARMVVFGGPGNLNDVWTLSLGDKPSWASLSLSDPPPGRRAHTAVYDPARAQMVIFGGFDGTYLADTWLLKLTGDERWVRLTPAMNPPTASVNHSMTYDERRERSIVFGGTDVYGNDINETWLLENGPGWTLFLPSGEPPPGRRRHSAVYDSLRDELVVFGGTDGVQYLNDTWILSLGENPAWKELYPIGAAPPPRADHTAILDPLRRQMVVFGGTDASSRLSDSWVLTLEEEPTWTELEAPHEPLPGGHSGHSAVFDLIRNGMIVFGGHADTLPRSTWLLDLRGEPVWSELAVSGNPPQKRWEHTAIHDPARRRMVVFGGIGGASETPRNDTWVLTLGTVPSWRRLEFSGALPAARERHGAVYDRRHDRMIVFGGRSTDPLYDLWTLTWRGVPIQEEEFLSASEAPSEAAGGPDASSGEPLTVMPNVLGPSSSVVSLRVSGGLATELAIYDVSGRLVRTLTSGGYPASAHTLSWDGCDDRGRAVAPGTYFLRLTSSNGAEATERITIVR